MLPDEERLKIKLEAEMLARRPVMTAEDGRKVFVPFGVTASKERMRMKLDEASGAAPVLVLKLVSHKEKDMLVLTPTMANALIWMCAQFVKETGWYPVEFDRGPPPPRN